MGEKQWEWLEAQLKEPAELRIIASSIQVLANEHNWEKWGNFPQERERLLSLIQKSGAGGVVLISGDRHSAEISCLKEGMNYPLYDLTSSSLNQPATWHNEWNEHRLGSKYVKENYGVINIDWQQKDPVLTFHIKDINGKTVIQINKTLSGLNAKSQQ